MSAVRIEQDAPAAGLSSEIHGLRVDVHCADPATADALAARLSEFPAAEGPAADVTFVIDVAPPSTPHSVGHAPRGSRLVYESPAGQVRYDEAEDRLYISHRDGVCVVCDVAAGRVAVSVRAADGPNPWLLSRPLFSLPLMEMLKRRGRFGIHAAGLSLNGAGVLAAGSSGAGKSTLALALARAGCALLGDDLLFLAGDDGPLTVLPFADEIELGDDALALFPDLGPLQGSAQAGWPKRRLSARALGLTLGAPCRASVVLFPFRGAGSRSRALPITRDDALLALLPNVILTDRSSCEAHVDALSELVRTTDCYRLETGRDLDQLTDVVLRLVRA